MLRSYGIPPIRLESLCRILLVAAVGLAGVGGLHAADWWVPIGPPGALVTDLATATEPVPVLYASTVRIPFVTGSPVKISGSPFYRSFDGGEHWLGGRLAARDATSVAVDPTDGSIVYLGTSHAGVFRSADFGETWTEVNNGLPGGTIISVIVDPARSAIVYALIYNHGLFRSTNGGLDWVPLSTGLPNLTLQDLAIRPDLPSTLFLATSGEPLVSFDSGATWTPRGPFGVERLAFNPASPETVYAAGKELGVCRSPDLGETWSCSTDGLGAAQFSDLAADPNSPQTLFAASSAGLYRSADAGESWEAVNSGIYGRNPQALVWDPADNSSVFVGILGGVFKSADNGDHWTARNRGFQGLGVDAVGFLSPSILLAGTEAGIFRSPDLGVSWDAALTGLPIRQITVDPSSPGSVYAYGEGLWRSTDSGSSWAPIESATQIAGVSDVAVDPIHAGSIYLATHGSGVFRSLDGGETWAPSNEDLTVLWIDRLAFDPEHPGTLWAATNGGGIFHSEDQGESWTAFLPPEENLCPTTELIVADSNLYTVHCGGYLQWNWPHFNSGSPGGWDLLGLNDGAYVFRAAIDRANSSVLYAGGYRQLDFGDIGELTRPSVWKIKGAGGDPESLDLELLDAGLPGPGTALSQGSVMTVLPLETPVPLFGTPDGLFALREVGVERVFAQFGYGENELSSRLLLFNPDPANDVHVAGFFRDDGGEVLPVEEESGPMTAEDLVMDIPAGGFSSFRTAGSGSLRVGSAGVYSTLPVQGAILLDSPRGMAGVAAGESSAGGFVAPVERHSAGGLNSGIAVAGRAKSETRVDLTLLGVDGSELARAQLVLPPNGHLARFINEIDWDETVDLSNFQGLVKGLPTDAVSVTVIQTTPGEYATMPVIPVAGDSAQPVGEGTTELLFAQFGNGREGETNVSSQILLVNPNDQSAVTAEVLLLDDQGLPIASSSVGAGRGLASQFLIPAGGMGVLQTSGEGPLTTGSVKVVADGPLGGVVRYGGSIGVAGVGESPILTDGFMAPVETSSELEVDTGLALMNPGDAPLEVSMELFNGAGLKLATVELSGENAIAPNGHKAVFVTELDWAPTVDWTAFNGYIRATTSGPVAATILLVRPHQLATLPVAPIPGSS